MAEQKFTEAEVEAIAKIIEILVPLGIDLGKALYHAVRSVSKDLTNEQIVERLGFLEADASFNARIARIDAGGD